MPGQGAELLAPPAGIIWCLSTSPAGSAGAMNTPSDSIREGGKRLPRPESNVAADQFNNVQAARDLLWM